MKKATKYGEDQLIFDNVSEFNAYFTKEYDGPIPLISNWRNARVTDWVLADDGGVIQVLKRSNMKHPQNGGRRGNFGVLLHRGFITTAVGTFLVRDHGKMCSQPGVLATKQSFAPLNPWEAKIKNAAKLSKLYKDVARAVVSSGNSFSGAFKAMARFHKIRITSPKRIETRVQEMLRDVHFREFLMTSAKQAAKNLGITPQYVLQGLKDIADKKGVTDKEKRLTLRTLGDAIGMFDKGFAMLPPGSGSFGGFDAEDAELIEDLELGEGDALHLDQGNAESE